MCPVLLNSSHLVIGTYSVLLSFALVLSTALAVREAERRATGLTYGLALCTLAGALVGARAFWILQFAHPSQLWRALMIWSPGLVLYGGVAGGIATVAIGLRIRRAPALPAMDAAVPYLALGEGIARIGCFLAGCCWGRPCVLPWAVQFPAGSLAHRHQIEQGLVEAGSALALPVHPTQLYMMSGLILVFVLLKIGLARSPYPGFVLTAYLFLYGGLRFTVEAFRGDSERVFASMTVSQMMSLAMFVLAAGMLALGMRRSRCSVP
ncbi:MAG: prolipoprotein diacylglyceryl transferase [Candidatus Hydrogenedentes bacterium]|nr:prolipoprotein diacylglyceryl transferase [Candidatus Hydrogenedentota bacterium]